MPDPAEARSLPDRCACPATNFTDCHVHSASEREAGAAQVFDRDPCDGCDGTCGDVCPVMEAQRLARNPWSQTTTLVPAAERDRLHAENETLKEEQVAFVRALEEAQAENERITEQYAALQRTWHKSIDALHLAVDERRGLREAAIGTSTAGGFFCKLCESPAWSRRESIIHDAECPMPPPESPLTSDEEEAHRG